MIRLFRVAIGATLLAALLALPGCPSASLYRSARTLEPGESDVGAVISGTRFYRSTVHFSDNTAEGKTKPGDEHGLATPLPEVAFHRGIVANVEAGARLSLTGGYGEIDAKYRFYHGDSLHLAVAPAAGWAPWGDLRQARVVLPVLATCDLGRHWGVTAGAHVGYRWNDLPEVDVYQQVSDIDDLRWSMGTDGALYGGGLGFDWRNDDFYVRPMVTVERYEGQVGLPGQEERYGIVAVQAVFAGGWTFGKDVARFRKADEQLERLMHTPPPAESDLPVLPEVAPSGP